MEIGSYDYYLPHVQYSNTEFDHCIKPIQYTSVHALDYWGAETAGIPTHTGHTSVLLVLLVFTVYDEELQVTTHLSCTFRGIRTSITIEGDSGVLCQIQSQTCHDTRQ